MIRSLSPFEERFNPKSGNEPIDPMDSGVHNASPVEGGVNDRFNDLGKPLKNGDVSIYRPLSWLKGCKGFGVVTTPEEHVRELYFARDLDLAKIGGMTGVQWIVLLPHKTFDEVAEQAVSECPEQRATVNRVFSREYRG